MSYRPDEKHPWSAGSEISSCKTSRCETSESKTPGSDLSIDEIYLGVNMVNEFKVFLTFLPLVHTFLLLMQVKNIVHLLPMLPIFSTPESKAHR